MPPEQRFMPIVVPKWKCINKSPCHLSKQISCSLSSQDSSAKLMFIVQPWAPCHFNKPKHMFIVFPTCALIAILRRQWTWALLCSSGMAVCWCTAILGRQWSFALLKWQCGIMMVANTGHIYKASEGSPFPLTLLTRAQIWVALLALYEGLGFKTDLEK